MLKKQKNTKWVILATLAAWAGSFSVVPLKNALASTAGDNPYHEGTDKVKLSPAEKSMLLEYADNSKNRLEEALNDAQGKSFAEANDIYLQTIKQVIVNSYAQKMRSELLLRYALNQALEITFGVPNADGRGVEAPGVLESISNQDLLTVILEDSIHLALKYYQDDRTAIQKGTLVNLPYMQQAVDELTLSRQWLMSVMEPTYMYALSVTELQHFMNTAVNEDQTHRALFAEELTHVSDLIETYTPETPQDPRQLMRAVRVLRGELRKLQEKTAEKLRISASVGVGNGTASSGSNTLAMQFVGIQAGRFQMGSPDSESGRNDNENLHSVTLTHGFEMQTTDVTQAQYVKVIGSNPSYFVAHDNCPDTYTDTPVAMCPNHPVEWVSFDDAQAFIAGASFFLVEIAA